MKFSFLSVLATVTLVVGTSMAAIAYDLSLPAQQPNVNTSTDRQEQLKNQTKLNPRFKEARQRNLNKLNSRFKEARQNHLNSR